MTPVVEPGGSVTSPAGFSAGATFAGIKSYGENKLDLGVVASETVCSAAAVFTLNRLHSASVDINRAHLADNQAQAVVVNSGVANSSTGSKGIADGRQMGDWVAAKLAMPPADVLVCSTGVIGQYLPMEKIRAGVEKIAMAQEYGRDFARAIMTTDTRPKQGAVHFGPYTLGGCAKGSGMIHPNMATMLAFLTTDAPVEAVFLREVLKDAVDESFNLVSVDGDTSPSDTVILMANGMGGGDIIAAGSPLASEFTEAVRALCVHLAREIARDGEGATKLMEINISGAASEAEARELARLMTTSYLLKSAVHGADPNWGRIISVVGRSTVRVSEPDVTVSVCGFPVYANERPLDFDAEAVSEAMKGDTVTIDVGLGVGAGTARAWGCDLSAEYVAINADYHT